MSHLEPPDSLFDIPAWSLDYEISVKHQLAPVHGDTPVAASAFCLPSFDPEWAVFLTGRMGRYAIQFATVNQQIYGREINRSAGVRRFDRAVADDIANRISTAFELALAKVRYPTRRSFRCDGTTLHFAASGLAGQAWSPPPETIPGMLTSLALAMRNHTIWSASRFDESVAAMTAAVEWIEANHEIEPSIEDEETDEAVIDFTELES